MSKRSVAACLPVKMDKKVFIFGVEFDIGEYGSDFPSVSRNDFSTIEQTRAAVPANGVRMAYHLDEAMLKRAAPDKYFVIIDHWVGTPQTQRARFNRIVSSGEMAKSEGKSWQEYHDEKVELMRRAMKNCGERIWWSICGEQDTGALWPNKMFKSKKDAFRWFQDCYLTNKPGRYTAHRKMANFPLMKNRYKIDFKRENIAIHVAMCFDAHYIFEWGARLGWMERNCWLSNNQIGIAFMRGAASQFKGYWGLDFSPWGEPAWGTSHFNKKGFRKAGLSENLHLREWIAGFYSGANFVLAESSASCAWIDMGGGRMKLSPYGENAKKFCRHAVVQHPGRGTPHVPVALMLEHNHGWDPRDHRIWGGRVPYARAEQMLDNFFNLAFPGQEEGFYVSKWMPDWSPQFPWKDEDNLRRLAPGAKVSQHSPDSIIANERDCLRKLLKEGFDTRPYERGMLVNSQWGDSFDVVLENCPLEALCRYKLIILLGGIQLTEELEKKLRQYAEQGGELVVNIRQVNQRNEKFLGVKLTGKLKQVCYFYPTWKRIAYNEISDIELFSAASRDTEVLETANGAESPATLVRRRLGKGAVYFSGVPYLQNGGAMPLAEHSKDFLDWMISRHLLVKARPGIQYLVNRKGAEIIVTLINNYEKDWVGEIVPVKTGLKLRKGMDLWNNKPVPVSAFKEGVLKITCPAFGFRALSLEE